MPYGGSDGEFARAAAASSGGGGPTAAWKTITEVRSAKFWEEQRGVWASLGKANGGGRGHKFGQRIYEVVHKGVHLLIDTEKHPSYPFVPEWRIREIHEEELQNVRKFCEENQVEPPDWYHEPTVIPEEEWTSPDLGSLCDWACIREHPDMMGCASCKAHKKSGRFTTLECREMSCVATRGRRDGLAPRVCITCWNRFHEGKNPWGF